MIEKFYQTNFVKRFYPIFGFFKPTKVITKEGFLMNIHKSRDYISDNILWKKEWESSKLKIFQKYIKSGDIVADIGANIGYYTLLFSRIVNDGKVYAFEPETANFDLLNRNIEENNIENVNTSKLAISDKPKNVKLYFGEKTHGGGSIIGYQKEYGSEIINTTTLDDFFKGKNIDFLKLDVEGSEFNILKSGKETLKKVRCIVTEFVPHNLVKYNICNPKDFIKLLEKSNFKLFDIDEEIGSIDKFDLNKFQRTWKDNKNLFKDILCLKNE